MPKPQHIDRRLLDFIAQLVTADENAADLPRIELLKPLAEARLIKKPRRGLRQCLDGSSRREAVYRSEKVVQAGNVGDRFCSSI